MLTYLAELLKKSITPVPISLSINAPIVRMRFSISFFFIISLISLKGVSKDFKVN